MTVDMGLIERPETKTVLKKRNFTLGQNLPSAKVSSSEIIGNTNFLNKLHQANEISKLGFCSDKNLEKSCSLVTKYGLLGLAVIGIAMTISHIYDAFNFSR